MSDIVEPTEFVGGPRCGQVMDVPKCFDDLRTPEVILEGTRGSGITFYHGIYRRAARRSAAGNAIFEWQGVEK